MDVTTSIKVKEHDLCVSRWIYCNNMTLRDKKKLWPDVCNKPFMQIWNALKTYLSLRLTARVKKRGHSRGPVWEDVTQGGDVEWMFKGKKRTGQTGVLPCFLWEAPHWAAGRSCREMPGPAWAFWAAVVPAARGRCRPALFSFLWPLGEKFTLSAPLTPRALCPGSHENARLYQVCGWYLPGRHLHTWMESNWESSGSPWVHQAENIEMGYWFRLKSDELRWWYLGGKNFSINHPVGSVTKKMEQKNLTQLCDKGTNRGD